MSLRRPPWQEFKAALEAAGFHPSKRLGQNFMLDVNTARAIVADAGLEGPSFVLEIGVGCGFLSCEIVAAGHNLLGVEIDRRLFEIADDFLTPFAEEAPGQVELIRADALAKKRAIEPEILSKLPTDKPWHLISNLPYSVASPILVSLSRLANPPASMTALVQLEVAERIGAKPGSGTYGGLSAKLGLLYARSLVRRVGPNLFWPPPKVDSAVARLELLPEPRLSSDRVAATDDLIEACFQARRKTLRATLGRFLGNREEAEERLKVAGIEPTARPETLGPKDFVELLK